MNKLLIAILLSLMPISEVRGAIPFALKYGFDPVTVFFLMSFFNIMAIPITFFFLDNVHHHCLKVPHYDRFFNLYIERVRRKVEEKIKIGGYLALLIFVAIPIPTTGAYTGTLIAWFFKLNRKHSFIAISLGVLGSSLIVTLLSLGIIRLF